eukprot:TRINITY_DN38014_c0_g2_i1.p1 TRINITY_DN38014_c0_g2~~TRINITY_DN38014_c0_g2_i1.p1  ORF type:complete len:507 (+),score=131.70 TRINITY_DN38014_c0_g2_i1:130-1650(+)
MPPKDKGGKKPGASDLCMAAANADIAKIRSFVNQGLKIDKGDYDKRTALHLASSEGKLPVVRRLVEELNAPLNGVDQWGGTALDDAIRCGHKPVCEFLIGKGAIIGKTAFAPDDAGILCQAGREGNVACLRGIVRRGVDINTADYDKRTAIHLAASEGKLKAIKVLIEELKADPNVADRFGGTPLDDAVRSGHKEVKKYLTEKGAGSGKGGAVSTSDAADLCSAAEKSDLNGLRNLVQNKGIDVNAGDYDLRTAIHLAAAEGLLPVLKCLFDELDANPNVVDRWGGTPLNDARGAGHAEVVAYLESMGGVIGKTALYTMDGTLMCDLAHSVDLEGLRGLVQTKVGTLQYQGVDVNTPNMDKRTALHIAAADGSLEACTCIIEELGANVNSVDRWNGTPLDDANQFGHAEVADYLRSKGGRSGKAPPPAPIVEEEVEEAPVEEEVVEDAGAAGGENAAEEVATQDGPGLFEMLCGAFCAPAKKTEESFDAVATEDAPPAEEEPPPES